MDLMTYLPARPAALPRLTANEAQALSLVARHGADFIVELPPAGGAAAEAQPAAWRVGFTPGVADALRQAMTRQVAFEWSGALFRLSLPDAVLSLWLAARLPDLAPGPLPEALQAAALEALLGEAAAALSGLSPGGPARVLDEPIDAHLPNTWTLTLAAHDGANCRAVLECDSLGLMLLAGLLSARVAPADNALHADALPVRLRAEIGAARLPSGLLQSLRERDVVLLDEYFVGPQGELWLGIPQGQGLRVRAEQSSYLVTQGWTSLMTETPTPAEHDAGQAQPAEPLDLDAIPVRLTFDLGERSLTLAELRRLQPGETFDLQRPLTGGPVMIRANGALLGTGSLVEVDGRVGVTIATLGKPAP